MALRLERDGTLNLVDQGLTELPRAAYVHAAACTALNLSENALQPPIDLSSFSRVHTLVLDKNALRGVAGFVPMPAVTTLWVNNNFLENIVAFLDEVARAFPAVTYLSCMRNPCSPPLVCLSEEDVEATRRFRLYVVFRLPRLQFLDSSPVSPAERREAAEKGPYLAPRRPAKAASAGAPAAGGAPAPTPAAAPAAAAAAAAAAAKAPASFLGVGASAYDGRNSEGNRFITDANL